MLDTLRYDHTAFVLLLCPIVRSYHPHQDAAIEQCIREYEGIAVWAVTRDATTGAIASVRFPEEDINLAS